MNSGLFNAKNLTVADESELIFRDDPSVSGYSLAGVDSGLLGAYAEIDRKKASHLPPGAHQRTAEAE